MLNRYAYPCRYSDLIHRFGRAVLQLCMITNTGEDWIYRHHNLRLSRWNADLLSPPKRQDYANYIAAQGFSPTNCFGFIDAIVRPVSRPGENQKAVHALKFQSVTLTNGLISHLFGPVGKGSILHVTLMLNNYSSLV